MHFEDLEPDRRYFTITELAKELGLNHSALRFWEKEFKILKPRKNGKGDRLYTHDDVKLVRYIQFLLKTKGYTIEGAKKMIDANQGKPVTSYQLIERLKKVQFFLKELKQQL